MRREDRVRLIFTYGTLMSSAAGDMGAKERALLNAFGKLCGHTRLRGRMYHAGACPATVLGGASSQVVYGELWQFPSYLPDVIHALDLYEGCAPESPTPHPYARRRVRVRTPEGQRVTAWMYVWVKSTDDLIPILDGRWRGPLKKPAPARALAVIAA